MTEPLLRWVELQNHFNYVQMCINAILFAAVLYLMWRTK